VAFKVPDKILESPGWKTFFSVVIPVIVGILSGMFVVEISHKGGLDWSSFYRAKSFYGLLAMMLLTYGYHRAVFLYEREVLRFLDDDYCRAYMRSKCLPEAAERYKTLIRSGDKGELVGAMKEFEKILK
jgi:hypothetical protein